MCGRYALLINDRQLWRRFVTPAFMIDEGVPDTPPRYNIAPTQPVPIIRDHQGEREVTLVSWGLVPGWVKELRQARRPINARSETAADSGMFRAAMKYRRCLVPASGFYEWKKLGEAKPGPRGGKGKVTKQPYYICMADDEPFAMAGLWEHWQDEHGNELETCTVLTTTPNEMMRDIHDRMPVILHPEHHDRWLDAKQQDVDKVADLLRPFPADQMYAVPVDTYVNSPKNDNPRCTEEATGLFG